MRPRSIPKLKRRPLALVVQGAALHQAFPDSSIQISRSELVWRSALTPSPLSRTYTVELRFKVKTSKSLDRLSVVVLDPPLRDRQGERPPHLYPGDRLCLYLPRAQEWNPSKLLLDTIVPWTSEWLLHYEVWQATGEWCGGGMHPA